jgi:hypothetical protein
MPRALISLLFSIKESLLLRLNLSSLYAECLTVSDILICLQKYKITS